MRNLSVEAAEAFAVLVRDPVVSYWSAAELWGMSTLRPPDELLHLTRPRRSKGAEHTYDGLVVHHAGLPAEHRTVKDGVRITTPARTVVDIARSGLSVRAGVVVADSALRLGLCDVEDMLAVCRACQKWPGAQRARAAVSFADPGGTSPLESISRWEFARGGLPAPRLQQWITPRICVDFLWRAARVIGEADGRVKYTSPDDLYAEKLRQEHLERLGYRVVRWGWDDVIKNQSALLTRLTRALVTRS